MPGQRLEKIEWRPPCINTERLILRGWEPSDQIAVYEYASDAEVTRHMAWDRHRSLGDAAVFLNEVIAPQYANHNLSYAVCFAHEPEWAIGAVGVFWTSRADGVLELGYVLRKDAWGQGVMLEACRALIPRIWRETDAERIFAPIFSENKKSRRLAEKLGLHLDGVLRSQVKRPDGRRDVAIYSVLRGEARAGLG